MDADIARMVQQLRDDGNDEAADLISDLQHDCEVQALACIDLMEGSTALGEAYAALTAELEAVRRDAETEAEVIARVEETANLIPELAIGNYVQGYRAAMSRIKTILASRTAQGGRHAGT